MCENKCKNVKKMLKEKKKMQNGKKKTIVSPFSLCYDILTKIPIGN